MNRRQLLWLSLVLLLTRSAFAENLLIAAAAGYKRPIVELSEVFEKKTGVHVEQIYGHMAGIVAQAKQSGQVAVILGDLSYLERVEGISFSSFVPLGEGRLAVGWPKGEQIKDVLDLEGERFARIAVPDTKAAIYGLASMEFLQRSGLEGKIKNRLQIVSTIPQVSAYLISGEIDAGFFNLTEALAIKDKIGGYLEVDRKYYSPIHIVAGIVKGYEDQATVKSLSDFLKSADARSILAKNGL